MFSSKLQVKGPFGSVLIMRVVLHNLFILFLRCSGGRILKMHDGFSNFFKHLALYHLGEITRQDMGAALQLAVSKSSILSPSTPADGSNSSSTVAEMLVHGMAGADERNAAARKALAAAKKKLIAVKVEKALVTMVVQAGQPFAIAENTAVKAAFAELLDEVVVFPSVRTLVRRVDAKLTEEEKAEAIRVKELLSRVSHCSVGGTHDIWTTPANESFEAVTFHVVSGGKLLELAGGVQPTKDNSHG